jgi:hypothetical protein
VGFAVGLAHTVSHHAPQIAIAPHPAASGQRPAPREDGNGHPGTHLATPGPPAKNTYRNGRARRAAKSPLGRVPIRWDRHSHRRPKVLRKSPELSGGRPSGERTQNDRWVLIFYVNTSHYCLSSPLRHPRSILLVRVSAQKGKSGSIVSIGQVLSASTAADDSPHRHRQ